MLLLGCAIGWFGRELTLDKNTKRTPRTSERDRGTVPDREPRGAARKTEPAPAAKPAKAAPEAEAEPAKKAAEADPVEEMVRTMAKQWKGMSSMFAKQRIEPLLREAGFDAETAKKIEELIAKEAGAQTEKAIRMMLGYDEIEGDAFYWFLGVGPELSGDIEGELATFLNDEEIAVVRAQVSQSHKKQLNDMADMTLGMMGIRNLSDDQRTRIKEHLVGKDLMQEQFVRIAQLTRDREKLRAAIADPKKASAEFTKSFEPTRRRMKDVLTPAQFQQYESFEKQMAQMSQMQFKMMEGLLKPSATQKPAGQ